MSRDTFMWQVIARAFWLENERKEYELRALRIENAGLYRALTAAENRAEAYAQGHEALTSRVIQEGQNG